MASNFRSTQSVVLPRRAPRIRYYWPKGLPIEELQGGTWVMFVPGRSQPLRVLATQNQIVLKHLAVQTEQGWFVVNLDTGCVRGFPGARLRIDRFPHLEY